MLKQWIPLPFYLPGSVCNRCLARLQTTKTQTRSVNYWKKAPSTRLKENHKDGYISAQEREARRRRAEEGRISRERLEQYYATGDLRIDPDRALAFMDDYRMKAQKDNPKRLIGVVSGNQLLNICD
ncbi:hypothetical protein LTS18_008272, partial [Coniosporium uncinatum]